MYQIQMIVDGVGELLPGKYDTMEAAQVAKRRAQARAKGFLRGAYFPFKVSVKIVEVE